MVGAHKYFNGSRDMITPLSGMICHLWDTACYDQKLSTKCEVLISTQWEDIKGIQNVENEVIWGSYGSFKVCGNNTIQ